LKICAHIDHINTQKWQSLLEVSPYASPFQTPDFFDFNHQLDSDSVDIFAVEEKGAYTALMLVTIQKESGIKHYFSRRGTVNGGMLLKDDKQQASVRFLLAYVNSYYKNKLIYLEIRNNFDYSAYKALIATCGLEYVPWLNYQFHNVSAHSFRSGMSKARQRQLNKALRNGATWREAKGEDDIKAFYAILSDLYTHKVKKPLPTFDYFLHLSTSSIATCLLVVFDGNIIGGVICPIYTSKALYEYYICGLDKQYSTAHPSIMAMWAMAEYAESKGVGSIDLMGAGRVGRPSSVRDFKSKFGGSQVEYGRFLYVFNPLLYTLGRWYVMLKSRLR